MRTVAVITALTFQEALRKKVVLAALVLGFLFLVVFGIGFYFLNEDIKRHSELIPLMAMKEMRNFMLMAGLYVINFLTMAMAILTSIDTLSGEIASGTVQTLAAKPVRRSSIVLGKWIGFLAMLTLYVILMSAGVIVIVFLISGYWPTNLGVGLGLLWLNGVLFLNLSFFSGSRFSTLTNGVIGFGLYGIAFVGGWVEQFGWLARKTAAIDVGIVASLLFPAEALWKRAAFEMQSPLVKALGISPFSSLSPPSSLMIVYAVGYALLALFLSVHKFGSRDL
jgi:Cu-processing system permease protein